MADGAYTFIKALGDNQIDIVAFSLSGMVAQDFTVRHPESARRLGLIGTSPRGGKDIDKAVAPSVGTCCVTAERFGLEGFPALQLRRQRQSGG